MESNGFPNFDHLSADIQYDFQLPIQESFFKQPYTEITPYSEMAFDKINDRIFYEKMPYKKMTHGRMPERIPYDKMPYEEDMQMPFGKDIHYYKEVPYYRDDQVYFQEEFPRIPDFPQRKILPYSTSKTKKFPDWFDPRNSDNMKILEKVSIWFDTIPFTHSHDDMWINKCYPPVAYPEDEPDTFDCADSMDVIEFQARLITRYALSNYMNDSEPVVRSQLYWENNYNYGYPSNFESQFLYKEEYESGSEYFQ